MLASTHSKRSKRDRKAKRTPANKGMPTLTDAYNAADDLVELCYVDIANGMSRSQVIEKLQQGLYGNKPYAARQAANYYNAALDRFAVDTDIEAERLRNLFWGRYEALYEDCVKNNDRYNARGTLDSMAKIFLGMGREKALIEINKDGGNLTVSFNLNNDIIEDQEGEIIE